MNESYFALEIMMKQRQRDILRDAELRRKARTARGAKSRRPSVLAPLFTQTGRYLVAVGARLETRAARAGNPPVPRAADPACST